MNTVKKLNNACEALNKLQVKKKRKLPNKNCVATSFTLKLASLLTILQSI